MNASVSAEILILVPLALALLWRLPGLAPVRQAFLTRRPALILGPGERILAEIRPDPRVLGMLALFLLAVTMAAALAEQLVFGAGLAVAYLFLAPFLLAGLAYLAQAAGSRWIVTDRRVVTDLGASLPLAEIGRIAVAPARLRLDGQGIQSLRLTGLADAHGAARMIQGLVARRTGQGTAPRPLEPAQPR